MKHPFTSIKIAFKIFLSGAFDAEYYRSSHNDIGIIPPLLHWVFYGRYEEGREVGLTVIFKWLQGSLITGDISVSNARKIQRHIASGTLTDRIANQYGLNLSDYCFMSLIEEGKFDEAEKVLYSCSQTLFLEGAYYFAQKRMEFEHLPHALALFETQSPGRARHNRMLADICRALGRSEEPFLTKLRILISNKPSNAEEQIFVARLPWVEDLHCNPNPFQSAFNNLELTPITPDTPGRAGEFARNVKGFERIINCATANTIHPNSLLCVTPGNEKSENVVPVKEWAGRRVKFRVLMPQYWVSPLSINKVTKQVLDLQKKIIEELIRQGIALVPVFSTPLYDITNEDNFGLSTISYHTISRGARSLYFHYKEAYLPGYFSADKFGYSGWSSLTNQTRFKLPDKRVAELFQNSLIEKYVKNNLSKYTQQNHLEHDVTTKYIFIALQVPDDTVSKLSYMDRIEWVEQVCSFAKNNNVSIVIKVHPKDSSAGTKDWVAKLSELSHVYISNASVHDLIAKSLAVVTCNSGVGFEALMLHKPVITCGLSDYHFMTFLVRNAHDLKLALTDILENQYPATIDELNKFLYVYCHEFCLNGSGNNTDALDHFISEID